MTGPEHVNDPVRLVLWDIDGTLIDGTEATRLAYADAFRKTTGLVLDRPWQFDGRTERAAAADALRWHGLDAHGELLATFLTSIAAEIQARAEQLAAQGRVLPGAVQALAAVGAVPGVLQSVLTGNLRAAATAKLAAFGLDGHVDLRIGAFGDDAVERTDLPAVALARAARVSGRSLRGADTVIIGDTLRDVATALAAGAVSVAVATGTTSAADLRAAGAHVVLPDLTDTAAVLRAVTGA